MQWGLLLTLCRGWSLRGSPPWGCDGPPGCQSPACQLAPIHPLCSAAHTHAFHPDYAVWAEYINKTVSRDEMKSKAIWQAYNGHVCVCRCTWVQQLHIKCVMGPDHRGEVNLLFAERRPGFCWRHCQHAAAVHTSPFGCLNADAQDQRVLLRMHFDTTFACNTTISSP